MAALEHLYLHNNDLSGPVPAGLGMLSNLTNLWLRDNRLSGQIPPSLGDLPNLQRVRIGGNDFTGLHTLRFGGRAELVQRRGGTRVAGVWVLMMTADHQRSTPSLGAASARWMA